MQDPLGGQRVGGDGNGTHSGLPVRHSLHYPPIKRAIDALVAGAGLVILGPAMAAVATGVMLTLGRPVLFRQKRVGRDGEVFLLVKFRSMREARDAGGAPLPDETRVVPFGRFLRRTRLDELPGLINVLRGDMALVGPRPLVPATVDGFGPLASRRSSVRPGLTGWAQVNGNTLLSDHDKLLLDLWYIDHQSLWLDAAILLLTIRVVLSGERLHPGNIVKAHSHACDPRRSG